MSNVNPKVRTDIEFHPAQSRGENLIAVKDPLGLVGDTIALTPEAFNMLTLLDGTRNIRDLQIALMRRQGGVLISSNILQRILAQLDNYFLLDNERYRNAREEIAAQYLALPVRTSSHAGQTYPKDPAELSNFLDDILALESQSELVLTNHPTALVAPHIDLRVGKQSYASAYNTLQGAKFDRVIILGIGHSIQNGFFCLTTKDFETPLGLARTDKSFVSQLRKVRSDSMHPIMQADVIIADDLAHRSEHSIEFQLIFLQHVLASKNFHIVPILCGSFSNVLDKYKRPSELPGVKEFLSVLKELIQSSKGQILVVAGVDLSHVGPKFGHSIPASYILSSSKKHDEVLLNTLCGRDVEAFWAEAKQVQDQYNVCGFPALVCLIEILPPCRGMLLNYEVWEEQSTQSAVSFAAIAFTREDI